MTSSANSSKCHFIAINFHRFHDDLAAIDCTVSVLKSAKALREKAKITFFNHAGHAVSSKLATALENMEITLVNGPSGSTGESLNYQISQAHGFNFFYRVDADDLVSADRFGWQSKILANGDCDICGGALIYRNIKTKSEYLVTAPLRPKTMAFLMNHYFLHPTLAFRLERFEKRKLRYKNQRIEDKSLALSALKAALKVQNDPRVYGIYNLNPDARNGWAVSWLNLKLNIQFILAAHSYWAFPVAIGIFTATTVFRRNTLRNIRKVLFRH